MAIRARCCWRRCARIRHGARADSFDPISVGLEASTLGYGITFERPLLFDLSARVTTGYLSTSNEQPYDDNPWVSTFHQNNVLVAADWRPYAGRWRLSGGVLFGNDYVVKVAQSFGSNYMLNGNAYPVGAAGVVSAAHQLRASGALSRRAEPAPASSRDSPSPSTPASWCATARSRPRPPGRCNRTRSFRPTSPQPRPSFARISSSRSSASASSSDRSHPERRFAKRTAVEGPPQSGFLVAVPRLRSG